MSDISNAEDKVKLSVYVRPETADKLKSYYKSLGFKTKSDLIDDAINFYCGYLTADDINLTGDINRGEIHEVTLYFTREDTGMLHSEKREVEISDQLPLAQHVVSELIKGPQNEELQGCISDASTLIGVSISENKCYVDFKNNFLNKNNGSPKHNKLVVYSIVNDLCV